MAKGAFRRKERALNIYEGMTTKKINFDVWLITIDLH